MSDYPLKHVHLRLVEWGAWVAAHPHRLKGLGYPTVSTEYRLRRTAPGLLSTGRLLPRIWYCESCHQRIARRSRPRACSCGSTALHESTYEIHGKDARGKRSEPIEDCPEAEVVDKALGHVPPHLHYLVDAAVFKYLRGYSDFLSAKTLGMGEGTFRRNVSMLHSWLDAYFSLRGDEALTNPRGKM